MKIGRISLVGAAVAVLLCGCHTRLFGKLTGECHRPQEYQQARQLAPLKVPPGLDAPNVQGALVIPTLDETPPPPGPKDPCLDEPPRYKPPAPAKPAAG